LHGKPATPIQTGAIGWQWSRLQERCKTPAIGISTHGATAVILAMLVHKEKVRLGRWTGIAPIIAGVATLAISQ
jgi:uncharacterized membrane protein